MHSSRMRTARFSSHICPPWSAYRDVPGGCLPWECLPWGCLPRRVYTLCPLHAGIHPPPWTDWMTHACENITFPQLLLRTVISFLGGYHWIRNQDPSTRLVGVSPGFPVGKPVTRRSVCQFEQKKHEIKDIFTDWGRVTEFLPSAFVATGNVFTPVCHSVHVGGGVCLTACWDTPPPSRHPTPQADTPPGQTPPGQTPLGQTPPGQTHPPGQTPRTDTPPGQIPPSSRRLLQRTVRILLECILVVGEVPQIRLIQSSKNTKMFKKETPKYTD